MQPRHNDFDSIIAALASNPRKVRIAVVCPHDHYTCEAVADALRVSLGTFILIGDPDRIGIPASDDVEIISETDCDKACRRAVDLARSGRADVIMKGLVNTDNLLHAVLNKESGILPPGNVLSHVTTAHIPGVDRMLLFSDAAVIPFPTTAQFTAMTQYLCHACRRLGMEQPRVALIHCSEKSSPKFPVTESYGELRELCARGFYGDAVVDGPMDVKCALVSESARIKGIDSPIDGHADALIFPDIEAANIFYKTLSWLGHATCAGMIVGASVPVVLPSRADCARSKLCSLAMAAITA